MSHLPVHKVDWTNLLVYRFSYKFKVACKPYAMRFCGTARTKSEVVRCLSEQVLNSTVSGVKSQIPRECKQQLKAQLFQQRENIQFDPVLKTACAQDIKTYCDKVQKGTFQVRKLYIIMSVLFVVCD